MIVTVTEREAERIVSGCFVCAGDRTGYTGGADLPEKCPDF